MGRLKTDSLQLRPVTCAPKEKGEKRRSTIAVLFVSGNVDFSLALGESVKGYYPAAIPEETFLKVQARRADNKGKPTTGKAETKINNIFAGVAFCSCGKPIKVMSGSNGKYIFCHGRLKGLPCKAPSAKYQPHEEESFSQSLSGEKEIRMRQKMPGLEAGNHAI